MDAYVAQPKDSGTYPGIVVIQEAFGVNGHIKKVTERIAAEGYVAIAPDIFHRESERSIPYSDMPKAIATMKRVLDSKAMEDVGAAIAHLKSQSNVKGGFHRRDRLLHGRPADLSCGGASRQRYQSRGGLTMPAVFTMGNPSPLSRTGEIKCPMYLFLRRQGSN